MVSIWSTILRMSLIMFLAVFGNLFLVFVIYRGNTVSRQKISPVQLLLLHTCFADLLFAFLSIGSEIGILLTFPVFYAPDFACRLVRYLQVLPLYASPFLLVAISIDRYQAICRPLVHYRTDRFRRPNCLGLSAWLLAILCSIPQLLIWHKQSFSSKQPNLIMTSLDGLAAANGHNNNSGHWAGSSTTMPMTFPQSGINESLAAISSASVHHHHVLIEQCRSIYVNDPDIRKQAYILWFSTVAWLLPSLISAIFYYKVCSTVWKSRFWGTADDNLKMTTPAPPSAAEDSALTTRAMSCQLTREYVEGLRKSSTGLRNQISEFDRKRIQTVRLTLTIVICNFFLWLPFCAINVIQAFAYEWAAKGTGKAVITQIATLGNLNACVNPWIYILFNRKITKRALGSIIRRIGMDSSSSGGGTRQTSLGYRLTVTSHQHHQQKNGGGHQCAPHHL